MSKWQLLLRQIKLYHRQFQIYILEKKITNFIRDEIRDNKKYNCKIVDPKMLFQFLDVLGSYNDGLTKLQNEITEEINK